MLDFRALIKNPEPAAYCTLNGKEINLQAIPDRSLSLEDYKTVRANTPGFRALYPKLNDEALIYVVQNSFLPNCRTDPSDITYDAALKNTIVPELLKRLKKE